ncbi:MAG: 16S rRNA methyltransferase [Candidatus Nitrosocaldaceae archaeon]|nr:MAG: 16S rRNA methyltransferase [Candidatus Nitrosocaldaceae archaeon]
MLSLIIAEAALELVPKELQNHRSVINHSKRLNRKPSEILLDRSYHHHAMLRLKDRWKRGRPDLVHISLLAVTSTPLYREGLIDLYLHTITDKVLYFKNVRLPRAYNRFEGLIIDLFKKKSIKNDDMFMEVKDMDLVSLLNYIKPNYVVGLSRLGKPSSAEEVSKKEGAIIVGGFPRGHFSNIITSNIDELVSISRYALDTHVVCSRIIYEFEKRLIR